MNTTTRIAYQINLAPRLRDASPPSAASPRSVLQSWQRISPIYPTASTRDLFFGVDELVRPRKSLN